MNRTIREQLAAAKLTTAPTTDKEPENETPHPTDHDLTPDAASAGADAPSSEGSNIEPASDPA